MRRGGFCVLAVALVTHLATTAVADESTDPDGGLDDADAAAEVDLDGASAVEASAAPAEPAATPAGDTDTRDEPGDCAEPAPCAPAPPPLPDVTFRGTETFTVEMVGDNGGTSEYLYGDDDNFFIFSNSLYLQANSRPFDGGVRLDAVLFHYPPNRVSSAEFTWGPGAEGYTLLNYQRDFRVERVYGTVKHGGLAVTAGDFYVTFGRGMVLSLIKADDISLDNALRGGRVEYAIPRRLRLVLVAGVVNSLNVDPLTHQILEDDPLDQIAGGRVEWDVLDGLVLGAHVVAMRPRFTDEAAIDPDRLYVDQGPGVRAVSGGATVDVHVGQLGWYTEGNVQAHDNYRVPEGLPDVTGEAGWAGQTEASYDFDRFSLKGSGFLYRHWLVQGPLRGSAPDVTAAQPLSYEFRVALEPTWVPMKSIGNAWGGRLGGDLFLADGATQLTLANAVIKYEGGLTPQGYWIETADTLRVHPTLAWRQEIGATGIRARLEGGFLSELEVAGDERRGHLWHALLDTTFPISGPHSIHLGGEIRRHVLEISEGSHPYWVTIGTAGYDLAGTLGVRASYEYSDQTAGIDARIGEWTLPLAPRHYLLAQIEYQAPAPLDGLSFALTGGSQRGGKKCTSGGCREFPDWVGVRLETLYRF